MIILTLTSLLRVDHAHILHRSWRNEEGRGMLDLSFSRIVHLGSPFCSFLNKTAVEMEMAA